MVGRRVLSAIGSELPWRLGVLDMRRSSGGAEAAV
jgi:hypothetical protein